jgi:UDP-N-acetylmuramoyl-tripeptide--D-alanyl-D-alanine ligase
VVVVRREGESQDSAKAVALLQFDHDVGERDGAAAQADALDALVPVLCEGDVLLAKASRASGLDAFVKGVLA